MNRSMGNIRSSSNIPISPTWDWKYSNQKLEFFQSFPPAAGSRIFPGAGGSRKDSL